MGHFVGFFEGAETFLTLNCPDRSEGQFWGQKGEGPLEKPQEMPITCFAPDKKIISRTFKIRGTLVFLCRKERDSKSKSENESKSESERKSESKSGKGKEKGTGKETGKGTGKGTASCYWALK